MNKPVKQRRLRIGDIVRIGGHSNTLIHLGDMKIPTKLHNCFAMIQSVGEVGVSFSSSAMPGREFHIPADRISETLQLHEANKTFESPAVAA